jgi:hypothetical protein
MLLFLTSPWPALIIGIICLAWGLEFTGLKPSEWLGFLIRLPFLFLPEPTITEHKQLDQPTEEIIAANPGCGLILVGLLMVIYGIFKLFS